MLDRKRARRAIDKALVAVDNSTLVAVATCTTQAALRYVLHLTSINEVATLKSGDAGHQALALHFRGADPKAALDRYRDVYKDWAEENVSRADRLAWPNTYRILRRWLRKNPVEHFPFRVDPKLVEIGFAEPLDSAGEVVFVGRIDLIAFDLDGTPAPMDNKFTGRIWPDHARQFYMDSQMSGYVWATQRQIDDRASAAYINAIEFGKLPDSTRRCPKHGSIYAECGMLHANWSILGPLDRSPLEVETWRRNAERLGRRFAAIRTAYPDLSALRRAPQEGKFTRQCRWCPFFDFCAAGRNPKHAKSMLVREPWEPFEGAFAVGHGDHRTGTRGR